MYSKTKEVRESAKVFLHAVSEKLNERAGHQYGTILAGYWILTHDEAPTLEKARQFCDTINFSQAKESVDRKNEMEALHHLLSKRFNIEVKGSRREMNCSEMIQYVQEIGNVDQDVIDRAMQQLGLRILPEGLAVANSGHYELESQVFRGTVWSKQWSNALNRIKNSKRKNIRISGLINYATIIPFSVLNISKD